MGSPQDRDALKYYRVAGQRLDEANVLVRNRLYAASIYLAGYSVECILKALLITMTPLGQRNKMRVSLKDDFGHSLRRLRAGVIERRANMPRDVANALLFLSSWSPELRYEPGPGDPTEAARFLGATELVVDWASGRM